MIPDKIKAELLLELQKNKNFRWYQGWERSSGYIKSYLNRGDGCMDLRIYCEWKKKKEPTPAQQDECLAVELGKLCDRKGHPFTQKEFRYYVLNRYFRESRKILDDLRPALTDDAEAIANALEQAVDFDSAPVRSFYDALKKLIASLDTERAIETFTSGEER